MRDELTRRVVETIARAQHLEAEKVTPESTFEALGIDSMDAINIVFALENEFEITIPDDDVRSIRSVQDVIDGIEKLTAAAATEPRTDQ